MTRMLLSTLLGIFLTATALHSTEEGHEKETPPRAATLKLFKHMGIDIICMVASENIVSSLKKQEKLNDADSKHLEEKLTPTSLMDEFAELFEELFTGDQIVKTEQFYEKMGGKRYTLKFKAASSEAQLRILDWNLGATAKTKEAPLVDNTDRAKTLKLLDHLGSIELCRAVAENIIRLVDSGFGSAPGGQDQPITDAAGLKIRDEIVAEMLVAYAGIFEKNFTRDDIAQMEPFYAEMGSDLGRWRAAMKKQGLHRITIWQKQALAEIRMNQDSDKNK